MSTTTTVQPTEPSLQQRIVAVVTGAPRSVRRRLAYGARNFGHIVFQGLTVLGYVLFVALAIGAVASLFLWAAGLLYTLLLTHPAVFYVLVALFTVQLASTAVVALSRAEVAA